MKNFTFLNPLTFLAPFKISSLLILFYGISFAADPDSLGLEGHPVYPPDITNIEELIEEVQPLMDMTIEEVIAEVPEESGIFFIGCPNCHSGAQEMNVLSWKPGMGSKVQCNYCDMIFPNKTFPNNRENIIATPSGKQQVYRYYEDNNGYPYYFEAHAWYEKWLWIRPMAEKLAKIWYVTRDNNYGDRAAAITGRFAQVFPDYAVRFDYPSKPVQFFPADQKWPYEGLSPYRGAKWRWWAYGDIPTHLANVYDILMDGYDWNRVNKWIGLETEMRIKNDLLRLGYEFTTANPETYSNMSPGTYTQMIRLGRILDDPTMVHEAVKRFRDFFPKGFFADGWWMEGTPSYHNQTINSLQIVADVSKGYVDPSDMKGERFDDLDLAKETPLFNKALMISREAILPNGRYLPINDTWWNNQTKKSDSTLSKLWPAMGNATIGASKGEDQIMVNVNWSGNFGHSHFDNGSIILYAFGQELLSDIGYTHTKYRLWTIHTTSHNTVVIDQKGQNTDSEITKGTGRLKFFDDTHPHVKMIDVDASPAYSVAKEYRRRLVLVHAASGRDYVIDRFDVSGGKDHDWFLHGMCEEEGTLETSIKFDKSIESLVPEWGGKGLPQNQYDIDFEGDRLHSYGFLNDIKSGRGTPNWSATWRYSNSGLRSHILSDLDTDVFRFKTPSVRRAEENDNKLDDYLRNGIMQRHSGGTSTFIAVHEPFKKDTWIESVQRKDGKIVVRYKINGVEVEDLIIINDNEVSVSSSAGWKYNSGTAISGEVKSMDKKDGKWYLVLDKKVPDVNYIRLDFSDGATYYCPIESINSTKLELKDDPGFTLDQNRKVIFNTFPLTEHNGPLRYTLFNSKK